MVKRKVAKMLRRSTPDARRTTSVTVDVSTPPDDG